MKSTLQQKIIIIIIFSMLLTLHFPSISSDTQEPNTSNFNESYPQQTIKNNNHTILVEVGTSQGCGGCGSWNNIIHDEYLAGNYTFEYVEMIVFDHSWEILNNKSYDWSQNYSISSYPTSIFDGGFEEQIGSNPSTLPEKLGICENRQVTDIDAILDVAWVDQATLNITIYITNNEQTPYDGSIRSHITEIISRYKTNFNEPYHNGFLDYAFHKNITIQPSETYIDSVIWDGHNQEDAHGDSFANITIDNTKIYLGVFDDKGFCDETVVAIPYYLNGDLDLNQSLFDRGFPIRHAADGDWAGAQNFTSSKNTFSRAEIYMRKFGNPEFNLTVELRTDHPEGTLLDTIIFTPGEIESNWHWHILDFIDQTIPMGTNLFIVCPPAPSGVTTSFGYEWGYAFGDQYQPGAFWFTRDGGALWRDLPTSYEFVFKTYGY